MSPIIEKESEKWLVTYWRPAMAWQYFAVCLFDFLLAPVFLGVFSYLTKTPLLPWHPISLEGGGIYHASMGAIVGVAAWTRGQEKLAAINQRVITNGQSDKPHTSQRDN